MIRTYDGHRPKVHRSAFVHDAAEVIGRVTLAKDASIWPFSVLRADVDAIRIGEGTNIQDLVAVHCRPGRPTVVGRHVTVGHRAILHGARIGDGCLIGMGAVVMEVVLGRECLVGAGSVLPPGMRVPARSLVLGVPARVVRPLTRREIAGIRRGEREYRLRLRPTHRRTSRPAG